ncbi:hypothetical protein DCAR_0623456 [Daucus carota subsp. sativus]|uniref:Uncharacterized protein n=1 Tax=Daucus carota subsp. sativus TaxID=79200 RepID=A0A175YC41_DAUCS|nr:hypothetical protein DCAR_0623456 [Daucus carota subsp. sativus]
MDSLSMLQSCSRIDWKVRVRVSRTWKHVSARGDVIGISFIGVDDNASRMEGWIRSALVNLFEPEFVEGRVIDIQNFAVRPYRDYETNKSFRGDNHILLTPITVIFPVEQILPNFPMHVFCCIPLNLIPEHAEQESYLLDVVGIIQSVENFNSYTDRNGIEQSSVRFVLANNDETTISVTFWNNLAISFMRQTEGFEPYPITVIISSCKVIMHRGNPTLTNLNATRFYVNPLLPSPHMLLNGIENFVVG